MAIHSILNVGDIRGRGRNERLKFRWGHLFAYIYNLGDKIDWDGEYRPTEADQELSIPAYVSTPGLEMECYNITIRNDVIVGFEPSSLTDFESKEEYFERLMFPQAYKNLD